MVLTREAFNIYETLIEKWYMRDHKQTKSKLKDQRNMAIFH